MPYRGSDLDQGAGIYAAYAAGQENKRANAQAKQAKALQDLQMALMKSQEERAQRDQLLQEDRQARLNAQSEQGMAIDRSQEQRAQTGFNASVEDRALAKKNVTDQGSADYGAARFGAKELLTVHPELAPDFAEVQGFLQGPQGQALSPEAKALYVHHATQAIGAKISALQEQKFQDHLNNVEATGGLNDPSGDGTAGAALKDMLGDPKVPIGQKMTALVGFQKEQAKRKAVIESQAMGGARLREQFLGNVAHVAHGSPEEDQIREEIANVEQGVQSYNDARRNIHAIIDPKPVGSGANSLEGHRNKFMADAYLEARKNGETPDIKQIRKDAMELFPDPSAPAAPVAPQAAPPTPEQVQWGKANADKLRSMTPDQIQAAWDASRSQKPAGKSASAPPAQPAPSAAQESKPIDSNVGRSLDRQTNPERPKLRFGGDKIGDSQLERNKAKQAKDDAFNNALQSRAAQLAMTKQDQAEFEALLKSGSDEDRADFIAKIKAKAK